MRRIIISARVEVFGVARVVQALVVLSGRMTVVGAVLEQIVGQAGDLFFDIQTGMIIGGGLV